MVLSSHMVAVEGDWEKLVRLGRKYMRNFTAVAVKSHLSSLLRPPLAASKVNLAAEEEIESM